MRCQGAYILAVGIASAMSISIHTPDLGYPILHILSTSTIMPTQSTLPSVIAHPVRPTATALSFPPNSPSEPTINLTYEDLHSFVSSFTRALTSLPEAHRPNAGSVISCSLTNSLEFVGAFLGITNAPLRCVSAPLNPAYTKDEVVFYLKDTGASLLLVMPGTKFSDPTFVAGKECNVPVYAVNLSAGKNGKVGVKLDLVSANAGPRAVVQASNKDQAAGGEVKGGDVALVLHTSGTTGRPKGVPLTHLNLVSTMRNIQNTYDFTAKDSGLLVMPLFHVHGLLCGLLAPLLSGSKVVIPPKFSAGTFWRDFKAGGCTWFTAVPTIHSILLASPKPSPLPSIRFIRSCSSSLSPTVFTNLESTFGAPVLEAYAMSENAHQMCSSPLPSKGPRYPGSVGPPQGIEMSIRTMEGKDVGSKGDKKESRGEVCIRGESVMLGYLNNEKANKEGYWPGEAGKGRWFRTGDEGYLTEEGYLVLTGRLKELINRGGEKISPLNVDSSLLALPDVAEAVCFGVPSEKYGEIVWAVVVLKKGSTATQATLRSQLKGKIAAFSIPERILFLDAIPKTATGKIQRKNIATKMWAEEKEREAKEGRVSKL